MKVPRLESLIDLSSIGRGVSDLILIGTLHGSAVLINKSDLSKYYSLNIEEGKGLEEHKFRNDYKVNNESLYSFILRGSVSIDGNVKVCSTEDCVSLPNVRRLKVINQGGELIAILESTRGLGKKFLIINTLRNLVDFADMALLNGTDIIGCLAFKKSGNVIYVSVWERFTTRSSNYVISCSKPVSLECSANLCVLSCHDRSWVVSIDSLYPIPAGLKPLIRCGMYDYLYDPKYKLIVRSDGSSLKPLVILDVPMAIACLSDDMLLVSSKEGVNIIEDNLKRLISKDISKEVHALNGLGIFRTSRNYYEVVKDGWISELIVRSNKCVILSNHKLACFIQDKLGVLNAEEPYTPSIDILSNEVSGHSYIKLEIRPWNITSKLTVDSRLVVVDKVIKGDILELSLRPKILGLKGKVRVLVEDPLYSMSRIFEVISKPPRLIKAYIEKCVHVDNGSIRYPRANTSLTINVKIENTAPDKGLLKSIVDGMELVAQDDVELMGGIQEIKYTVYGRVKNPKMVNIKLVLTYGLGDNYELGSVMFNPTSYIIQNPLPKSLNESIGSDELRIESSLKDTLLRITCSNSFKYESSGCLKVPLDKCELPAVIEAEHRVGDITWYFSKLIDKVIKKVKVIEGNSFKAMLLGNEMRITLPNNSIITDVMINEISRDRTCTLRLNLKPQALPLALVYVCGNQIRIASLAPNSEFVTLKCSIDDLLGGLTIYTLIPGIKLSNDLIVHFGLRYIIRELLSYAIRTGFKLKNLLG